MRVTDGWCGRGLHWLEDTRYTDGSCRACNGMLRRQSNPSVLPLNSPAAPEVVERFTAMYDDGSWRAYVAVAIADLIDRMARYLVRNGLDVPTNWGSA